MDHAWTNRIFPQISDTDRTDAQVPEQVGPVRWESSFSFHDPSTKETIKTTPGQRESPPEYQAASSFRDKSVKHDTRGKSPLVTETEILSLGVLSNHVC
jgi:hypothetical protein